MTEISMALLELLRKHGLENDVDFLREGIRMLSQRIMELEVSEQIGAGHYERGDNRQTHRNGYRDRIWETRVGEIPLRIPKVRHGTYFPSLLNPRRRSEKALLAVVQQAYIQGVSTRKVDDLLQALGLTGIDKSKVSRICKELDSVVEAFRNWPLTDGYPYLWLDALYLKVRQNHRIVSQAVVIAIGVRTSGDREILGFDVGASEDEAFWLQFLRQLKQRGLREVQLVTSDAHEGLKKALGQVLIGATWQRCRVHFMRNLLAHIPKRDKAMVAAAVRTLFVVADRTAAGQQLTGVATALQKRYPKAAALLLEAETDILAYMDFPQSHWRRIYSTNPLERLNKEIKRRTNVVGIFPDRDSVIRLVGSLLMETDDEWQIGRRYFSQASMKALLEPEPQMDMEALPMPLIPIH
ncbi:MAG: transposase [Anaerolineae bacterium SG8_19]|nr:MAG: transposase [Anaerolineae bacterium SG8_19]